MDVVRRTGRAELCLKEIQQRTLLGDGSAHTKAVQGGFVLGPLSAEVLSNGDWRLHTTAPGF